MARGRIVLMIDRRRAQEDGGAGPWRQHLEDRAVRNALERIGLTLCSFRVAPHVRQVEQAGHLGPSGPACEGAQRGAGRANAVQPGHVGRCLFGLSGGRSLIEYPEEQRAIDEGYHRDRRHALRGPVPLSLAQVGHPTNLRQVASHVQQVARDWRSIFVQVILRIAQRRQAQRFGRLSGAVPVDEAPHVDQVVVGHPMAIWLDLRSVDARHCIQLGSSGVGADVVDGFSGGDSGPHSSSRVSQCFSRARAPSPALREPATCEIDQAGLSARPGRQIGTHCVQLGREFAQYESHSGCDRMRTQIWVRDRRV